MPPTPTSQRIRLLRPLLIFLVITAHIPGTLYRPDRLDLALTPGNFIGVLLAGVLAVTAMPTLSIISGYLAVRSRHRRGYVSLLGRKVATLLVPMVLWGIPMAFLVYTRQAQGIPFRAELPLYPFNAEGWLQALVPWEEYPANPPLYFLRELFLAFMLLPVFQAVSRYRSASVLVAGTLLAGSMLELKPSFIFRTEIYLFFFLGVLLATRSSADAAGEWLHRHRRALIAGFTTGCVLMTWYVLLRPDEWFWPLMKCLTLLGPPTFWLLGDKLSRTRGGSLLLRLSPASFTLFLGHVVVLNGMWNAWIHLFHATPYDYHYFAFWIMSIAITLASLWILWRGYDTIRRRIPLSRPYTA